jgi:hypothetical protein
MPTKPRPTKHRSKSKTPRPAATAPAETPEAAPIAGEPDTSLPAPNVHSFLRGLESWKNQKWISSPTPHEIEPVNAELVELRGRLKGQPSHVVTAVQWMKFLQYWLERADQIFRKNYDPEGEHGYFDWQHAFLTEDVRFLLIRLVTTPLKTMGFADAAKDLERKYNDLVKRIRTHRDMGSFLAAHELKDFPEDSPRSIQELGEQVCFVMQGIVEQLAARGTEPNPAGNNRSRRKAGKDDGRHLKAEGWIVLIKDWIKRECSGKWVDGIPKLHTALADHKTGIGFNKSPETLWRYSKRDKLKNLIIENGDTLPRPTFSHCSECGKPVRTCSCTKADPYESFNMPD